MRRTSPPPISATFSNPRHATTLTPHPCGCGPSPGKPATLAIRFSVKLFGQQETEYAKWTNRWQASFLDMFCDGHTPI